jgi:tetratricopeptide (TPR) repeat protein
MNSVGLRGAPGVAITLFAQDSCTSQSQDYGIACPALGEGCELAWQGQLSESTRGQCDDDSPSPKEKKEARRKAAAERKTRARAEKLHTQGMTAFRRGDLAAAEQAWKTAAPDSIAAINDLGFLYQQQKRYPEAERALLQTLLRDGLRMPAWLNIADLYWDAGKKGLARRAYAEYARCAASENKTAGIPPRVSERLK